MLPMLQALLPSMLVALEPPQGKVWTVDAGRPSGVVWNLYLDSSGSVASENRIGGVASAVNGLSRYMEAFGTSVCAIGDVNGDASVDLAVGSPGPEEAVWILFLDPAGEVQDSAKIDYPGKNDLSGSAVAGLGDLDLDGVPDLAVGAPLLSLPGVYGGVWILFLRSDGTVKSSQLIGSTGGTRFGASLCAPGDLDEDGVQDLIAGAPFTQVGNQYQQGALWILYLDRAGLVRSQKQINLPDAPSQFSARLGSAVVALGDVDADGNLDLAAGAPGSSLTDPGAAWVLFLDDAENLRSWKKIANDTNGFSGPLDVGDSFGSSAAAPGDLDGNEIPDLFVGAPGDDDGGTDRGAIWFLSLDDEGTVQAQLKITEMQGGFEGNLPDGAVFGRGLAHLGDVDGDGIADLAAGSFDPFDGVDPSADFADLPAAVAGAAEGDVLLVRDGIYTSLSITGKSLTVQGDAGGYAIVRGETRPSSLALGQRIALRDLLLEGEWTGSNAAGFLWIESCPSQAGSLSSCSSVVLLRSATGEFTGRPALSYSKASTGLAAYGSNVHAFECVFRGQDGLSYYDPFAGCSFPYSACPQDGGDGIAVLGGSLFAAGCSATGGRANGILNTRPPGGCFYSFPGAGLYTTGTAWLRDSLLSAGPAFLAPGGTCPGPGPSSPAVVTEFGGTTTNLGAAAMSLRASSPVASGASASLEIHGPPHVPVWIGASPNPRAVFNPALSGTLLVGQPITITFAGFTDADGDLSTQVTLPPLPPGVEAQTCFFQSIYLDMNNGVLQRAGKLARLAAPTFVLGSGTMVLELDDSL